MCDGLNEVVPGPYIRTFKAGFALLQVSITDISAFNPRRTFWLKAKLARPSLDRQQFRWLAKG